MEHRPKRFHKFDEEFALLQNAWSECFVGPEAEAQSMIDMEHPPPGFAFLVTDIMEEIGENLREQMDEATEAGHDPVKVAVCVLSAYLKHFAIDFYKLGNRMAETLPWEKLSPCGCTSPSDEELADLLSKPFELEGEGWVIKGFETKKEDRP